MELSNRLDQLQQTIYQFHDLMEADLPEPEWLIPMWLVNEPTIIAGRPKTFKSTFAMEMAVALTSGTAFLDEPAWTPSERTPVVYLMEENSAGSTRQLIQDIVERKGLGTLKKRGDGSNVWEGEDIPLYLLAREGFKLEDDWVEAVIQFCQDVGAKVVILDAWYRILPHGVEAKSGTDLAPVFDRLQEFGKQEDPLTIIMVAHTNKGATSIRQSKGGSGIMDSTYIEAFFEGFLLTFHADNGRDGSVDVDRFFRNKGKEPQITVELIDPHDRRVGWDHTDLKPPASIATTDGYEKLAAYFMREYKSWKRDGMSYAEMRNLLVHPEKGKVSDGWVRNRIKDWEEENDATV